jgi:DNA-binding NarL/FixJ family response regulator
MTRILIADDHEVVRSGLRSILETHPDWEVVAEAADGKEAIVKAVETKPDVAVVDYSLPLVNGIEVTRQIRRRLPSTEILIFTMHDNEALIDELLSAGARGFLLKSDAARHLLEAVETLASHKSFFTSKVSETLLKSFLLRPSRSQSILTPRERQIVQLIAEGNSNKLIASILSLSIKTVETHRAAVMRKLNLSSAAELVRYAVRNKFLEP